MVQANKYTKSLNRKADKQYNNKSVSKGIDYELQMREKLESKLTPIKGVSYTIKHIIL